jgi:hypothetical protein
MTKIITKGYSYCLLAISMVSLIGLLGAGHGISDGDFLQMKFTVEIAIFFFTGLSILNRNLTTDTFTIILLVLTQVSFIDIYVELSNEELNNDDFSIGITVLTITMTILTLYMIYGIIKNIRATQ